MIKGLLDLEDIKDISTFEPQKTLTILNQRIAEKLKDRLNLHACKHDGMDEDGPVVRWSKVNYGGLEFKTGWRCIQCGEWVEVKF